MISEYQSFEQKEFFFESKVIKAYDELVGLMKQIDELHQSQKYIFRGSGEARYKLYNSAQRYYLGKQINLLVDSIQTTKHDNYFGFLEYWISYAKAWNSKSMINLLRSYGINDNNNLAYLSLMQHYGLPTPLLDFTYNPYVALFFAVDNVQFYNGSNSINDYFSLYVADKEVPTALGETFDFLKNIKEDLSKGHIPISYLFLMKMGILNSDEEHIQILNNINIANQEGLFYYNFEVDITLEEAYLSKSNHIQTIGSGNGDDWLKKILSFNIHKSLIPSIKTYLLSKGITKDYIYADFTKVKSSIEDQVIDACISKKPKNLYIQ